jgi:Flp pilus assembly protein TadG
MMFRHFLRDQAGASAAELAVMLMLLMIMTFGVMDMGYALWQWNNAEKSVQLGVRLAAVSTPLAPALANFNCGNATTTPGDPCSAGGTSFGTVTCTITACTGGYVHSAAEANRLLARMQTIFPSMQGANLIVEYEDLLLSFDGRGGPVATVTVRVVNVPFQFMILDTLIGMAAVTMPEFRATLTTEDLDSTG